MKGSIVAGLVLASSAIASPTGLKKKASSNTPPVTVSGNAFWQGNKRFYIRGVDYQPGGSSDPVDPIANPTTCKRDIEQFQALGLNTVRVYTVDNTADHDECMQALSDAGIYLALDVNTSKYSLNRNDPQASYNDVYLQSIFATIDAFQQYDNTLLFFSGNEVINTADNSNTAPYIKAVTRDMKAYIAAHKYRTIPVGYSAADVEENRYQTAAYMNCGADSARSDFFSFNDYSWCDPNTFQGSGWSQKVAMYSNYSIPLFLSEYGCNKNPPREFNDVAALYNAEMTAVYSGGLVYEYSEEADNPNYGLVTINSDSYVTPNTDFNNLMKQLKSNPAPSGDGGYSPNLPPLACPPKSANWNVNGDALPVMPSPAQKFLSGKNAGKGPGLSGPGSQNAGTQASVTATPSGSVAQNTGSPASGSPQTTSTGAASSVRVPPFDAAPLVCGFIVIVSTLFGATLL